MVGFEMPDFSISIHAPPRGATVFPRRYPMRRTSISIHAPPRGATAVSIFMRTFCDISIHAPPRGATRSLLDADWEIRISIHAPPRGATSSHKTAVVSSPFQFTPLREGRHALHLFIRFLDYFNSRPSARGDRDVVQISFVVVLFQFTPLREGRRAAMSTMLKPKKFQFTPLREGRQILPAPFWIAADFNSRPSARGDAQHGAGERQSCKISIHAPPRGATFCTSISTPAVFLFQFTPLREGRRWLYTQPSFSRHFNSRPSARGDQTLT